MQKARCVERLKEQECIKNFSASFLRQRFRACWYTTMCCSSCGGLSLALDLVLWPAWHAGFQLWVTAGKILRFRLPKPAWNLRRTEVPMHSERRWIEF